MYPAIRLPRCIPRLLHRHVCEIERGAVLLVCLINQIVSGKLVLDGESYEVAFIFCHCCWASRPAAILARTIFRCPAVLEAASGVLVGVAARCVLSRETALFTQPSRS